MLERFARGENEFNRLEGDGVVGIIRIFSDQACEFAAFDELLEQSATKQLYLLPGLAFELFEILTA